MAQRPTPGKTFTEGRNLVASSLKLQGNEAHVMKRKAYDIFQKALSEFDSIPNLKDANGAKMKLKPIEVNQKGSMLLSLSKMSKNMDVMSVPSTITDDDNETKAKLDPKMQSEVNQLYYMLRTEETYKNEAKDFGMADRYRSESEAIRQEISEEAQERADTKFINYLEDEESISMAQQRATSKKDTKKTPNGTRTPINGAEKKEQDQDVKGLKNMDGEKEAELVKGLIKDMAKRVEVGSAWYIVSMAWISKWQKFVGFDENVPKGPHPGKIDNQDIIQPFAIGSNDQIVSTILEEMSINYSFMNVQLKKNLKEGDDYMLIDDNIFNFWNMKYDKLNEVKRFGIEDENGENIVEMHLKVFNLYLIPNSKYFKMQNIFSKNNIMKGVLQQNAKIMTLPIFISRSSTVKDLENKVNRCLTTYIYMKMQDKGKMIKKCRLWKSNYDEEEVESKLDEVDQKYTNYTHVKINADVLNKTVEQLAVKLQDTDVGDEDIIVVELPKNSGEFVFQPETNESQDDEFEDPLNSKQLQQLQDSKFSINDLNTLDLEKMFRKSSARGLCGLQNLGNTCFMNSGLQCLSNTIEMTKFFLFDMYKRDINSDNPLGMEGRLATAFSELLSEMWLDKDKRTAPHQLKRVLGKRVARFSGYGQQDSCELINYFLDLIHEDLNRVKKKPYVEMPDHDGTRSDVEMSAKFWSAFQARNQSIIVDLMYGQLKSTVRCTLCNNISITFDPYLTLPLPISRPNYFTFFFVPFDLYKTIQVDDEEESDEDFKQPSSGRVEHPVLKIEVTASTTILDLKKELIQKTNNMRKGRLDPENLIFSISSSGEVDNEYGDDDKVDQVDTSGYAQKIHIVEVRSESIPEQDKENIKSTELNFSKFVNNRRQMSQQSIAGAIPRYLDFHLDDTPIDMKRKIYNHTKSVFKGEKPPSEDNTEEFEEWLNTTFNLQIKDNTPYERNTGGYGHRKVISEFSGRRHNQRDDICEISTDEYESGNNLEKGGRQIKLRDLYGMLKHERKIRFEVMINKETEFEVKGFTMNRSIEEEQNYRGKQKVSLDACFNQFSEEELLSGDDQWYCGKCKEHRDAYKKLDLYMTPKILMLQLKRFTSKKSASNSGRSGFFNLAYAQICQQEKVDEPVDFPVDGLDVQKHVRMDCEQAGVSSIYDLFGVVNHFGSLNGGHYTATCKNSIDDQWYYFNDGSVSSAGGQKFMQDAAYVLFYRRREVSSTSSNTSTTATQDVQSSATKSSDAQSQDEEVPQTKTKGTFTTTDLEEEKTDTCVNNGSQTHYKEDNDFLNELD